MTRSLPIVLLSAVVLSSGPTLASAGTSAAGRPGVWARFQRARLARAARKDAGRKVEVSQLRRTAYEAGALLGGSTAAVAVVGGGTLFGAGVGILTLGWINAPAGIIIGG